MEQTARKFESVDEELQSTLSALRQKVAGLQSAWVGRGASSFQSTMETWSRGQAEINTRLRQTAELMRSAGREYAASDDTSATHLQNAGGGGGPAYTGL